MYEYKKINITNRAPYSVDGTANEWAQQGWRTVAVLPSIGPGHAASILIEREVKNATPTVDGLRLQRIFDEANGALPQDAGKLLNLIREIEDERG